VSVKHVTAMCLIHSVSTLVEVGFKLKSISTTCLVLTRDIDNVYLHGDVDSDTITSVSLSVSYPDGETSHGTLDEFDLQTILKLL